MEQAPKSNKRIVSKGQYVQAQGKRLGMGSLGCASWLMAALCTGIAFFMFVFAFYAGWVLVVTGVAFGVAALWFGKLGIDSFQQAETIDVGVPLTRKIASTLPAEESLVRPSEEPAQAQQTVLLRAATYDPVTPADQLVRPIGEPEP